MINISIIIPSAGRRFDFLQRSIKSALIDSKGIMTEIIVVLNGVDGLVFDVERSFKNNLVRYYKIDEGNVSKARNFGLSKAQGELVRFLDDDDYLIPDIALQQYINLLESDADVSTYNFESVDKYFNNFGVAFKKRYSNGFEALFSGEMIGATFNNVYRKSSLINLEWNENNKNGEDFEWFFNVLLNKKCIWIFSNDIVGFWFQHENDRLSTPYLHLPAIKMNVNNMFNLYVKYEIQPNFDIFFAKGLWRYAHSGFYLAPIYWTKIAFYARKLDPNSIPDEPFFNKLPYWIHPLIFEWLMLPKRWLNHQVRLLKQKLGYNSSIRKI